METYPIVTADTNYPFDSTLVTPNLEVSTKAPNTLVAWPSIILGVIGILVVFIIVFTPTIPSDRKVFGSVFLGLWALMWALILWKVWAAAKFSLAWWLLFLPIIAIVIFLLFIVIFNLGSTFQQ